ncbi:MAG: tetratricopeptide repeat protein [Verrucomicrobiaceae bacterium]|nr:tetratricopeptide repeat protein [Verrucomicrobiaceae bacterium]
MHPPLTQAQIKQHNDLYDSAFALIEGEILLDGLPAKPPPNFFAKHRLRKAIQLFQKVIGINSMNWNAMFAIAKIHQRLGNAQDSFDWMLKAREFAPDNTSLAKETALTAAHLGMYGKAIAVSLEAIALNPDDPSLQSNLGLSLLLTNNPTRAVEAFKQAMRLEPAHPTTPRLLAYARSVESGELRTPNTEQEIIQNLPRTA